MSKSLYFTTTLPYINARPHLGFALELVQADAAARLALARGSKVFLNTGTDEHGLKILRSAEAAGLSPQAYADRASGDFRALLSALGILPQANFIRTTDSSHLAAAAEFWRRAAKAGDIYLSTQEIKYCVGCELEKTASELVDDHCPLHPAQVLEILQEENYFFRFSKYADRLLKLYDERPEFVVPTGRLNEAREFVVQGLKDFSISRLFVKQPWGVPVPDDPAHTMYVWFDALVNYLSAIGWPASAEASAGKPAKFWEWWPVTQFAGKDNLRQQAVMWQAMLMSVGLPPSRQIVIHGFVTSGGQKMSKSLGNVIDPFALVEEYGTDAVRYFLLRHLSPFEDGDFTLEKFKEAYNANLANGLGNLVSRVMKLAEDNLTEPVRVDNVDHQFPDPVEELVQQCRVDLMMDYIWENISDLDLEIQESKPWESKDGEVIKTLVLGVYKIGYLLQPLMPQTAELIMEVVRINKKPDNLFPRK